MAIEQIERLPDVSFIDDDINLDGIQKQMLQDYQDKYMEETGEETVLDRGEPIALILYACSVQIYQMYMYVDRAGKQNLLKYAFGAFLDNLAALKGIERTAAKPATVTMRFTLSEAQTGAIAIPAGTRVTDGEAYFTTDKYAEIKAGETTVDVACTSIETGVDLNGIHEGAIQTLVDPIPYIESVTNITETDGGADPDDVILARAKYQGQMQSYAAFSKKMNLPEQKARIMQDGLRGRFMPTKTEQKALEESAINAKIKAELSEAKIKGIPKINPEKIDVSDFTYDDLNCYIFRRVRPFQTLQLLP